jgi:hypothetical protein
MFPVTIPILTTLVYVSEKFLSVKFKDIIKLDSKFFHHESLIHMFLIICYLLHKLVDL